MQSLIQTYLYQPLSLTTQMLQQQEFLKVCSFIVLYLLYNEDIIKEYDEVLHRAKFKLSNDQICTVIELVKQNGIDSSRFPYAGEMPDEDDRVFYEVCLSKEDSFLVTGNLKHFPKEPQVITAAEMMEILDNQ